MMFKVAVVLVLLAACHTSNAESDDKEEPKKDPKVATCLPCTLMISPMQTLLKHFQPKILGAIDKMICRDISGKICHTVVGAIFGTTLKGLITVDERVACALVFFCDPPKIHYDYWGSRAKRSVQSPRCADWKRAARMNVEKTLCATMGNKGGLVKSCLDFVKENKETVDQFYKLTVSEMAAKEGCEE